MDPDPAPEEADGRVGPEEAVTDADADGPSRDPPAICALYILWWCALCDKYQVPSIIQHKKKNYYL